MKYIFVYLLTLSAARMLVTSPVNNTQDHSKNIDKRLSRDVNYTVYSSPVPSGSNDPNAKKKYDNQATLLAKTLGLTVTQNEDDKTVSGRPRKVPVKAAKANSTPSNLKSLNSEDSHDDHENNNNEDNQKSPESKGDDNGSHHNGDGHSFDDDIDYEDDDHNEGYGGNYDAANLCNVTCEFPITELNLTSIIELPVARFKKDAPSLEYWLNYTCPISVELERKLKLTERHGFSHLRYEHIKGNQDNEGGFRVRMWGTYDLVNTTRNLTVGLVQKKCRQNPVPIQFKTTNPLNITPSSIRHDHRLSPNNCTSNFSSVTPFNISSPDGGEISFDIDSTGNGMLDVQLSEVGFDLQGVDLTQIVDGVTKMFAWKYDKKGNEDESNNHERKGRVEFPKNGTWSTGYTSVPGIPANISIYTENQTNGTRVHVRIGKGKVQSNVTGNMCVGLSVNDGISANDTLKFFALSLSDSDAAGSGLRSESGYLVKPAFLLLFALSSLHLLLF